MQDILPRELRRDQRRRTARFALTAIRYWFRISVRVVGQSGRHSIGLVSGGVAFFMFLSLPAIATCLIALYGLAFNPADVIYQIQVLNSVLPKDVSGFFAQQIESIAARSTDTLQIGFYVSLAIAVFGARAATASLMTALNIAYSIDQRRGILRFQMIAIGLTICAALYGLIALTLLAILPLVLKLLSVGILTQIVTDWLRWAILIGLIVLFVSGMYRFAPAQQKTRWLWVSPGAVLATVLWLVLSAGLSIYVADFAPYQASFGPISSLVVLLLWLWLSVYSILFGAELNAVLAGITNRAEVLPKKPK